MRVPAAPARNKQSSGTTERTEDQMLSPRKGAGPDEGEGPLGSGRARGRAEGAGCNYREAGLSVGSFLREGSIQGGEASPGGSGSPITWGA